MKKIFSILVLTTMLAAPALALAQGPGQGIPAGYSEGGCTMKHEVRGCIEGMTFQEGGETTETDCGKDDEECYVEACCLLDMVYTIADWIFVILLVVAALFIIWGAFQFVLSGGDPEKVTTARNKLIWALVGIIVAFISRGLVRIVAQIIQQ